MRPHNRLAYKSKRRSNPRRGESKRGKPARVYLGGGVCPDGARRPAVGDRPGGIRGRRGTIGGYWGGYNSLSSSPTPRALPGKVENLTPPANGKNAPDGAPPADQPHYRHRDAPRRNHCRQCRPKARAAAHAAPSALAFFFCPSSRRWTCCLPAAPDRLPDRCGSVTARPGR